MAWYKVIARRVVPCGLGTLTASFMSFMVLWIDGINQLIQYRYWLGMPIGIYVVNGSNFLVVKVLEGSLGVYAEWLQRQYLVRELKDQQYILLL